MRFFIFLFLRDNTDLTLRQMAQYLKCNTNTVKTYSHRRFDKKYREVHLEYEDFVKKFKLENV